MNKCKAETPKFIANLAIYAYDGAQIEAINARNWPSRSLSREHITYLVCLLNKATRDSNFVLYCPPVSGEMQEIIGKLEMDHITNFLKDCLSYSIEIDGTTGKQQIHSKQQTAC